ncbi:RNA polymerase sigma factor [Sphingobacterium phlebotomi]|uniref:RNA polymerase sigma factor n=1 Tax=Sphingobacterium phlebotomi TaxID=2605433 RepID=UPI00165356D0|nr:sigma-70 family RNA polymerase sigma factor [Sphingobacterium phlebotomi]
MTNKQTYDQEKTLLLALKQGNEAAFDQIYETYKHRIFHNLKRMIKIPEVVNELHQDIFLKLWQYRARIDENQPLASYLFTIAKNVAIDFYKKAEKEQQLKENLLRHMELQQDDIENYIRHNETKELLEKLINKLPAQRQKVFRLIKLENQTYEYAATHFGVSVGTIKDHMAKAIRFLQTEFKKDEFHLLVLAIASSILL